MQANPRNVIGLFEQTLRYVVPIFQRHYVWQEEKHWLPLWEDIIEKLEQRITNKRTGAHFFGAVILDAVKKQSTREISRFLVIDGQQRIMTIQLLLTALRDIAFELELTRLSTAVGRTIFNPDPELMQNSSEEIYKMWPTKFNRQVFCDIVNAGSFKEVDKAYPVRKLYRKKKPEPRDRLIEAYVFFYKRISEFCKSPFEGQSIEDILLEFYGVLKDDFAVVEIILGEQDDSQEIFNSLNANAEPLSQSDLLRSFVFMRAEKNTTEYRDRLYEQYWSRFEDRFWDIIERRGNLLLSRLDQVTRIFLSSNIGSTVEAKKVHMIYKNWIQTKNPFQNDVEAELKNFSTYGDRFRFLITPPSDAPFSEFAQRLQTWDVSTTYPLVIFLFEECKLNEDDLIKCFNILESFVVRRLICRKDNKEYNKYFVEIVDRLRRDEASPEALQKILAEGRGETRVWPDDNIFREAFCEIPIYNSLKSNQISTILKIIEDQLITAKTEKFIIQSLSVEHIMPQAWNDHYPLDGEFITREMVNDWWFSDEEEEEAKYKKVQLRDQRIHCFGNLTIVTQPLNSAMKNARFTEKKEALRNSILLLNRYFDNLENWDEKEIDRRSRSLFETARYLWTGPPMP
jgi:uncharacterized protein with ParB-like and HNH nuclease domain